MHHQFHIKVPYFLKNPITELYITNSLRSFSLSMINLFLPIFFLQQGYSFSQLILFYMLNATVGLYTTYVTLKFANKYGAHKSIGLSMPIQILFFLILYNFQPMVQSLGPLIPFYGLTILGNISGSFYYMGFHINFGQNSNKDNVGHQIGTINALSVLLSIAGPFIGALIIFFSSFKILFLINASILIVASGPLFLSNVKHKPQKLEKLKPKINKIELNRMLPYYAEGMHFYSTSLFWPLLIFYLGINLKSMGSLFSLSNLIFVIFSYYIGKKAIEKNRHKLLKTGATIHSLSLLIRTAIKSISLIAFVQSLGALSYCMVTIPFSATFYNSTKTQGLSFIYSREIYLHLGRITALLIMYVVFQLNQNILASLIISIVIAAVAVLLMPYVTDEHIIPNLSKKDI